MQCLTERKSERKFDSKPLPPQILSDLLYAADGISRPDGRKTVPTARNLQSQEVYAAMADGLYLYHPKTHSLDLVKAGDIREKCGMQAIHKTAPIVLIYVGDVSKIGKNAAEKVFYAANHAGYASQNVYLYCTSAGLATVVCGLVNKPELEKAMEVYAANDCFVLSDEIWSDLILPGYRHIPTLSVSDDARRRTAAFYAPSKTFSLAGLIGSYHIIPDPWLRDRVTRQGDLSHYNSCNVLSLHALLGAYSDEGAQWLDELRPVLADNIRYACDFIAAHFPGVQVMQPQGTYMLFLDCAAWLQEHHMTLRELEERGARAGVIWQDGAAFAWPDSIRMNLALPHSRLVEAMERLRVHAFC